MAVGQATLAFGAVPGLGEASVVVTGQAAILGTSLVEAFFQEAVTGTNDAVQHRQAGWAIRLTCGAIVAGTGFTIFADVEEGFAVGDFTVQWVWN